MLQSNRLNVAQPLLAKQTNHPGFTVRIVTVFLLRYFLPALVIVIGIVAVPARFAILLRTGISLSRVDSVDQCNGIIVPG